MEKKSKHDGDFDTLVAQAFGRLPDWIQAKVKNVAIIVEDIVDTETVHDMNLDSHMDLLGLYKGVPLIERTVQAGFELPDTIVLYRLPIQDHALDTGKPVADVVFETLWHEIAHHFGLGEEDVQKRESEEFGA